MLNLDPPARLLIAAERAEQLRRDYGAVQPAAGRQADGDAPQRTRGGRLLDRLLRRPPAHAAAYHG